MQILKNDERDALLKVLQTAPDEVLLDAVRQTKDHRLHIQNTLKEVQGYCGLKAIELPKPQLDAKSVEAKAVLDATPTARKNINPGRPAIGKIGTKTTNELLDMLSKRVQPAEKWTEHMKLLWSRDIVKWDGSQWYV